jgi:ABC-type dipeptide/oligopeptide/nickel transport system permease subunit
MRIKNKKITKEMKWGIIILSFYLFWAIIWFFYKYFILGTIQNPYSPNLNIKDELILPFTNNYILGTDLLGRSLMEVLSAGLSYSLVISIVVTLITSMIGISFGYLAARGTALWKLFFDLIINIVFIFPGILIAILVMAITGKSISGLIFALILTGWSGYAKITRSESRRILNLNYVEGAKAIGISELRLFFKIIIPELLPIIMVNMILGISGVILSEAALGFLGLGGSPFSWGSLLSSSKTVLLEAPHLAIILSLTMSGLIIGLNLLGDGLRDYLDPKL